MLVLKSDKTKYMLLSSSPKSIQPFAHIQTLQGSETDTAECYEYLGLRLETRLTSMAHVEHLSSKLKIKIGFLDRNKSCFSSVSWKITA